MQNSLSTLKIIFVATLSLAFAPIMEAQTTFNISPNGLYPGNGYQGTANLIHLTDTSYIIIGSGGTTKFGEIRVENIDFSGRVLETNVFGERQYP